MAVARGSQKASVLRVVRRPRHALMASTALQAAFVIVLAAPAPAAAQPAPNAQPSLGRVSAGAATVTQSATTTTVTQTTGRAALNWQSFDVGSQQTVTFAQPNASSIALNRVTGPNPSQIAGRIDANGQIALVNQSGVVFYKGAQVNAQSVIVSAAGITDQNFMAGKMVFDQAPNPNARVENQGQITVKQAGLAALVAPQVANSGTITAKLGHVILAGAETHTLDLYGDGLLSIDVTGQVKQAPVGPDGKPVTALVTNTGTVIAAGGTVLLTAQAADGLVRNLVSAGGRIAAPTVGAQTGTVEVTAAGGSATVTGSLSAVGRAAGTKGGQVQVSASDTVTLAAGSRISVSGKAGGGTVALGTTLARAKGGGTGIAAANTKNVVIQQGATVSASATANGNGGQIVALATQSLTAAGALLAKGGPRGGNGGGIETSAASVDFAGIYVNTTAPAGHVGNWLVDPTDDLDVTSNDVSNALATTNVTLQTFATGSPSTTPSGLGTAVQGTGAINVNFAISSTSGNNLTLTSYATIAINAPVNIGTGTLALVAGGAISQGAADVITAGTLTGSAGGAVHLGVATNAVTNLGTFSAVGALGLRDSAATLTVSGPVSSAPGVYIVNTGGAVVVDAGITAGIVSLTGAYGITLGATSSLGTSVSPVTKLNLSTSTYGVAQNAGGVIYATELGGASKVAGAVKLTSAANHVTTIGAFTAGNGFTLIDQGALTVNGPLTAPTVSLSAPSIDIPTAGAIAATTSTMLKATTGAITEDGTGSIKTALLTGSAGGDATLNGANAIGTLGSFTAAGFMLTDPDVAGALTVNGPVTAPTVSLSAPAIDIPTAGAIVATTSTSLTATAAAITEDGTGSIRTGVLSGSAIGDATLNGPNNIGTLGTFTAAGFTLTDPDVASVLTVNGTVIAPTVTLSAPRIGIAATGTIDATTSAMLTATAGTISEAGTGSITTALLTGSAVGDATLTGINDVGTLGLFTAAGFSLADQDALKVNGLLTAPTVVLSAPSIEIAATGTIAATTSTMLTANTGTITEAGTGSITTALLTGSAGGDVTLTGLNSIGALGAFIAPDLNLSDQDLLTVNGTVNVTNLVNLTGIGISQTTHGVIIAGTLTGDEGSGAAHLGIVTNVVAELGPFSALDGFGFRDSEDLKVVGAIHGGPGVYIITTGSMVIQAGITAAPVTGTVSLTAAGISEDPMHPLGLVSAGTLTGSSTGGADFGNAANAVSDLGSFTASGGNFALVDSIPLTIVGTVAAPTSGATIAITDSASPISPATSVTAIGFASTGTLTAGEGIVDLSTTGTGGNVIETTGLIHAGTLQSSLGVTGGADFASATNAISNLGAFTAAGGNFTLVDRAPLTIVGAVAASTSGATIAITDSASPVAPTPAIGFTGSGSLTAGASVPSTILYDGIVDLSTTGIGGNVDETVGFIAAGTLQSTGGVTGSADLASAANVISNLGRFTAAGGNFSLLDSVPLTIVGAVAVPTSGATIAITDSASPVAPTPAIGFAGTGSLTAGAAVPSTVLHDGTVDLSTTGTLGDVEETTGFIAAGTLQSSLGVTGGADFASATNVISNLGSFTANGGSFALMDAAALTVDGAVGSCAVSGATGITTTGTTAPNVYNAITVAAGALVYSLDGTVTMTAAGDFVQAGGLINGPAVAIESQHGNITQSGGTIAAIGTIAVTADAGSFTQSGTATIAANGDISVLAATGITLNGGTILSASDITLGSDAGISQSAGTVAANGNLTLGGKSGVYMLGDITQTGGTLSSGETLTFRAGTNMSQSGGGTTYADVLDTDSTSDGVNNFNLSNGPAPIAAGPDQIVCPCAPLMGGGMGATPVPPGSPPPGPPAKPPVSTRLPSEIILRGGTIMINKPEITVADGIVELIAHGSPGNINEVIGGSIQTGTLVGEAEHLGAASLGDADPSIQNLIGTLYNFTTDGNFVLTDAESLAVTGTVAVGQALLSAMPPPAAVVNLASITVLGALTIDLGASIISGGTLPVPATPGASLYPGGDVTLVAMDNTTADPNVGGIISISGKVAAIAGKYGGGTVTLDADQKIDEPTGINAPGQIIAGTLTGAAGRDGDPVAPNLPQSVTLNSQTNQIDQLGAFTAPGDIRLTDYPNVTPNPTQTLNVVGAVQVGNGHTLDLIVPSLALAAGGSLTANAVVPASGTTPYAVTPGLIVLQADAMSLRLGTVTAGDGTVAIAPLNQAALGGGVVLSLDPTTVSGRLSLTQADISAIHTIGTIGAGNGPLGTQTLALGSLDGATPSATTASVQINTGLNLTGVASTLALFSTTDIQEGASGAVTAHALTASAPNGNIYLDGANTFAQTGNIATVGAYTTAGTNAIGNVTAGGNVLLANSQDLTVLTTVQAAGYAEIDALRSGGALSGNLTVTGVVDGANVYLRAGNQSTPGNVTIATGGSVVAPGLVDLAAGEQYTPATPSSAPVAGSGPGASSGALTIAGSVDAGTAGLYAANTIDEAGIVTAGTLTGASGAATNLVGANQVGQLGNFAAAGGFTMDDGQTLAIAGAVSGGPSATVTVTGGDLGVSSSVDAGAVTLNAGNIAISGGVAATTATLTANLITIGGTLSGSSSVHFAAGGAISETGSLTAGTLSGSTLAGASLTGSNAVADLGTFTAGSGFTLNDTSALTVTGAVNGGPSVTIADAGALTIGTPGSITATAVTLTGSSIGIAGAVNGPTSVTLTASSGGITEGGSLDTALLSGSAPAATSLTGTNAVAVLGNFSSGTGLALTDGTGLTVTGAVNGGPAITLGVNGPLTVDGSLTAGTVAVTAAGNIVSPGSIVDGNSVSLVSTGGAISQTGLLVADTLTGSAVGSANFTGATASTDQVGTLGSFTVSGGSGLFTLNDGTNLLINGPVSANTIVINDGSNQVTLGSGGQIVTGGTTRPGGVSITLPSAAGGNSGAYVTAGSFTQTGSSTIGGAPSIFSIDVQPGGGNIAFDTTRGLQAPNTWLVLQLGGGHATGNIFVQSLDVAYNGNGGGSTLTGTVGDVGGQTAAAGGYIAPRQNSSYLLNSCPIHSVNCVILPSSGVPTADPLNNFDLSTSGNPEEQDELWLPIVSGQDY